MYKAYYDVTLFKKCAPHITNRLEIMFQFIWIPILIKLGIILLLGNFISFLLNKGHEWRRCKHQRNDCLFLDEHHFLCLFSTFILSIWIKSHYFTYEGLFIWSEQIVLIESLVLTVVLKGHLFQNKKNFITLNKMIIKWDFKLLLLFFIEVLRFFWQVFLIRSWIFLT